MICRMCQQGFGKFGVARGEEHTAVRRRHGDGEAALPEQRVVERLRHARQPGFVVDGFQQAAGAVQFAAQRIEILFDEVLRHGTADQVTEHQQNDGRHRGEKKRQTQRQRNAAAQSHAGASKT